MTFYHFSSRILLRGLFGGVILVTVVLLLTFPVFSSTGPATEIRISNAPIFSQETGLPVPNAVVSFYCGFKCIGTTRTNSDGRYSIRIRSSSTAMPTMMIVSCDGYHPTTNSPIKSFAVLLGSKTNNAVQAISKETTVRGQSSAKLPTGSLLEMLCNETVEKPEQLEDFIAKCRETLLAKGSIFGNDDIADFEKNTAANELFSLPELPDGVVADLARMFEAPDEDEVWRDYCLQFLGSALERTDGVTDEDRALARETLVEALAYTNATFAGTALRALHRGDPDDPLVALNALRIARDSTYPSASRITALLVLEECTSLGADGAAITPEERRSILLETADIISRDSSATSLLRQTAEAVLQRVDPSRGLQ